MASAQANHPLYDTFSDVGFRGRFQILEMNETTYHVRIWEDGEDGDMEVLWTTTAEVDPWSGSFRTLPGLVMGPSVLLTDGGLTTVVCFRFATHQVVVLYGRCRNNAGRACTRFVCTIQQQW